MQTCLFILIKTIFPTPLKVMLNISMSYWTALIVLVLSTSTFPMKVNINAIYDEIPVHTNKNYSLNNLVEYIISISDLPHDISKTPPRAFLECYNCSKANPAIIILKQKRTVTSFELPIIFKIQSAIHEVLYNKTERTLCPYDRSELGLEDQHENSLSQITAGNEGRTLIVSLSTSSKKNITVNLEVVLVTDFLLQLDVNKTFSLTPSSPRFYLYEFSNHSQEESVILEVESEVNNCMIVSIQNRSCPIVENQAVYYNGFFQTVTQRGGMTIKGDKYPKGFHVVFSLRPDDSYCLFSNVLGSGERSKTVVISLRKSVSTHFYTYVVLGTLGVFLLIYIVMILITHICFMRKDRKVPELVHCTHKRLEPSTSESLQRPPTLNDSANPASTIASPTAEDTLSIKTDSSLDETDLDMLTDADLDKNIFRTKVTLYLSDLAKKKPTVLRKKSELYVWNLMTVAIFYGLPASQMVVTYQSTLNDSGNEDLCYFNFLCSHPLGSVLDFNHVFSNVGYVALGLLFLIITRRKAVEHDALVCQDDCLDKSYGVPQHFGLYYAMGTSLMIEGLFSACYHICPNRYNFQFDASFMYIISALCMIKIYQSRHPDVNATAYSTFFLIAAVLFLNICGIFTSFTVGFWIVFTALHIGTLSYISLQIYYVGRFEFDWRATLRWFKEFQFKVCRTVRVWMPLYPKRFCLIVIMDLVNWGLAISALVIGVKNVSSYLILIFVVNLMMFTTWYIIMKKFSGEKILLQSWIYMLLAVLCWSSALFYFFRRTISWKKTPAESRMYNKPCVLFDFYDDHDIWHFLSSGGLFFSFLVLLTLDDDLIFVHRSKIPVF